MLFRFTLVIALTCTPIVANQEKPVRNCCATDADRFSPQQIEALLERTEPIDAPCCADMLHIKGTMVVSIAVGTDGDVTCVEYVSGHPLIIGVTLDSVRQWRFRAYAVKGLKKKFCGRITLHFEANEHAVKYRVI